MNERSEKMRLEEHREREAQCIASVQLTICFCQRGGAKGVSDKVQRKRMTYFKTEPFAGERSTLLPELGCLYLIVSVLTVGKGKMPAPSQKESYMITSIGFGSPPTMNRDLVSQCHPYVTTVIHAVGHTHCMRP